MTSPDDLDALAARALLPDEEERVGGWLARTTPGSPLRRVNSARPVGVPLDVDALEAWYAARGARALVMLAPEEPLTALDDELAGRGWEHEAASEVLVGDPDTVLDQLAGPPHAVFPGELDPTDRSLDPIVPLVAAGGAGRAVVVLQERWSLLRGLEVDEPARRQGIAAALVRAWARLAEGRGLYLQMYADNEPARALYERAGFTRSHGYHYRRAPAGRG